MKPQTIRFGFTEITIKPRKTVIYHGGNMGNTVDSVRQNVDRRLGEGVFDKCHHEGIEDGHPSYMYTLTLPTKRFVEILEEM